MNRHLALLAAGSGVVGIAIVVFVRVTEPDPTPAVDPMPGIYRIIAASIGDPDLVGREFIVRKDGPELVAGLCPDLPTCRRWQDGPASFRYSLASLPADASLSKLEPAALLSTAQTFGGDSRTTTTLADGRCRHRVDAGSLERTPTGLQLQRELAQTELVERCESTPMHDRVRFELSLARLPPGE